MKISQDMSDSSRMFRTQLWNEHFKEHQMQTMNHTHTHTHSCHCTVKG